MWSLEIISLIVSVIGVLTGAFISYHLYFLSKKLSASDRLNWRLSLREQIDDHVLQIKKKQLNSKCELININRYHKDYPHNNDKNWFKGYTYTAAELKDYTFDGLEFIDNIQLLYQEKDCYVLRSELEKSQKNDIKVFRVGVIPYEWITAIDLRGDEYSYRPQLFVKFKGKGKYPFKYYRYYKIPDKDGDYMHLIDKKIIGAA